MDRKRPRTFPESQNEGHALHGVLETLKQALFQLDNIKQVGICDNLLVSEVGDVLKALETSKSRLACNFEFNLLFVLKTNALNWVDALGQRSLLSVAMCNSSLISFLSPIISRAFQFTCEGSNSFVYYAPTTLLANSFDNLPASVQRLKTRYQKSSPEFCANIMKIPPSVTQVGIVENIINLPPTVTSFKAAVNMSANSFPSTLTRISLIIQKFVILPPFPSCLKQLSIHDRNATTPSVIPPLAELYNLKKLKLNLNSLSIQNESVLETLPLSLEVLDIYITSKPTITSLPPALKILKVTNCTLSVDKMPHTLKELIIEEDEVEQTLIYPPSLTHLHLLGQFNRSVDKLPPSITHLILGEGFNRPIDHLPPSLTHLWLGESFDNFVDNLPRTLQSLQVGLKFNKPLPMLPSLKHLILEDEFFFEHFYSIPGSVTHLHFGAPAGVQEFHLDKISSAARLKEVHLPNLRYFNIQNVRPFARNHRFKIPNTICKIAFVIASNIFEIDFSTHEILIY